MSEKDPVMYAVVMVGSVEINKEVFKSQYNEDARTIKLFFVDGTYAEAAMENVMFYSRPAESDLDDWLEED